MKIASDIISSDIPTPSPTIVVVEDEALVRMVIADYLRDRGFRLVEAGTADEAITMLRTNERVDIVFSDVQMPGSLDGFGLARWVQREQPGVKVILASGMPRAADPAGEPREESPPMHKPYKPGEVERQIRKLLAQ